MSGIEGTKWGMSDRMVFSMKDVEEDAVTHPSHYISQSGIESIDVIKAFIWDLPGYSAYATGNILKYIMRWSHKNGVEDLKKARWYLNDLIDHLENGDLEDE